MNTGSASLWPLRFFAFALIPLACWQLWLFPSIPNYYAQHALLYPSLFFMLWAWVRGLWNLAEVWRMLCPFLPWLALLFALQAVADWRSARLFLPEGALLWRPVGGGLIKLAAQVPFVFFFAVLWRILLRDESARRNILRGAVWAFVLLAFWCALQAVYVYTVTTPFYPQQESGSAAIQGIRRGVRLILENISPWLEARWPGAVYDFYAKGAYALTLTRFNGFFEEASALATMTGVFFVPLSFGLLGLAGRTPYAGLAGGCILTGSLGILIFCRSATGLILSAVVLALLLLHCLQGRFRLLKILAGGALVLACACAFLYAPRATDYISAKVRQIEEGRTPRIVTTLDTVDMIKAYPLLGVGRDWYFAHLHVGQRYLANLSDAELRVWKKQGSGGELSALPALAAQYGLPVVALALAFVGQTWLRLWGMRRARPDNPLLAFMLPAATAWLVLGLTASFGALDIRNPLFCLPFFCFYAVSAGLGLEDTQPKGGGKRS